MNRVFNILIFFCFCNSSFAQIDTLQPQVDSKHKVGFNFSLGNSFTKLQLNDISFSVYSDSLNSITKNNSPYLLQAGGLYELMLTDRLIFRPMFLVFFDNMNLMYDKKSGNERLEISTFGFNIPLNILLQTKGKKMRYYLVGGPSFNFGFGADNKTKDKINPRQFDITADIGFGIRKILVPVCMTIEARFSQGTLNLKGNNQNLYTDPIKGLYRQNLWVGLIITAN